MFSKMAKLSLMLVALLASASLAQAAEAESLKLSDRNGPWLVMVTTFADTNPENAFKMASALATELRTEHKMNAYIYEKRNTEGAEAEGQPYWVIDENNPNTPPRISNKYKYRNPSASTEFAVLVGNFPSVSDKRAAKTLETIRKIQPKCLSTADTTHPLYGMAGSNGAPMTRAFIVANPLVPRERFVSPGLDSVVLNANKNIKKYSLLDCPGTYSVQVAVLKGVTTLNQQKIAEIRSNGGSFRSEHTLEEADRKAIVLCEELRQKGYDAYVFRDHYASIVTVGSFDNIGNRKGNDFVLTPQVMNLLKTFSATCDPTKGLAGIQRKILKDIPSLNGKKRSNLPTTPFDITPRIIVVPRRPVLNTGSSIVGM